MGRPARVEALWEVHCKLPVSLRNRIELELFSPLQGRVPHGAFTKLVEHLLRRWLLERERAK